MQITIKPPRLTNYQKDILYCPERFTITEAATKCGKTFSHIYWLFEQAHKGKDGYNYWWVAPVYGQAEIAFNRMKRKVAKVAGYSINLSKLTITTPLGTVITFKTAQDPDNLFGEDVYAAVFDEFTRAKETAWHALRSTLTATKGKCKLIGNSKGKKNWGHKLGLKAKAGEPGYRYFKITAWDAVEAGILDREEVEQAQRDLPEVVFNELYLAEPSEDGTNPFGISHIRNCFKKLSGGVPVVHGIDLAKSVDWTVDVGLNDKGEAVLFDRWQGSWNSTKDRIKRNVGRSKALIDSTGVGDPIVEDLQKELPNIEGFKFSSSSKQQLMEGLAIAIQQGSVSFDNEILKDELEAFEFEYTRTGVRYSAPEGMHDDGVCGLALAWSKYNDKLTHIKRHKPIGLTPQRR